MSALSDHVRRDAQHAARSEIRVHLMRFMRRMDELAKAEIAMALDSAKEGEAIDGLTLGREAAASAIGTYLSYGGDAPEPAIDGDTARELEAGE